MYETVSPKIAPEIKTAQIGISYRIFSCELFKIQTTTTEEKIRRVLLGNDPHFDKEVCLSCDGRKEAKKKCASKNNRSKNNLWTLLPTLQSTISKARYVCATHYK